MAESALDVCGMAYSTLKHSNTLVEEGRVNESRRSEGCYDIWQIIFGVTEPISDYLSTVLWPHHYSGAAVLAEIVSRRIL